MTVIVTFVVPPAGGHIVRRINDVASCHAEAGFLSVYKRHAELVLEADLNYIVHYQVIP